MTRISVFAVYLRLLQSGSPPSCLYILFWSLRRVVELGLDWSHVLSDERESTNTSVVRASACQHDTLAECWKQTVLHTGISLWLRFIAGSQVATALYSNGKQGHGCQQTGNVSFSMCRCLGECVSWPPRNATQRQPGVTWSLCLLYTVMVIPQNQEEPRSPAAVVFEAKAILSLPWGRMGPQWQATCFQKL